ncbi:MAG: hypothetical protein II882_08555 [Lachnospiraceae bacterium]|nr:hypothetical protein [Lachnospiraceae bacterium]
MTSPAESSDKELTISAEIPGKEDPAAVPAQAAPPQEQTVAAVLPAAKPKKIKRSVKKRQKLLSYSADHDIRYRGPLSYRHFRILAWTCIVLGQVAVLLNLDLKLEPEFALQNIPMIQVFQSVSTLAVPFLLIANFATILDGEEGYPRQLIRYSFLSLSVIGFCFFLYKRYLLGITGVLIQSREEAPRVLDSVSRLVFPNGFVSFNIFMDLFLCSLFMFLLNYRPKRFFRGKSVIILRLLAIVPVLYELASFLVKIMASNQLILLPVWAYPFLTTKAPMTFVVFIILAFYVKKKERIFRKYGKTHEELQVFLKTNYNSLRFSLFTSKVFLLAVLLDFLTVFIVPMILLLFLDETRITQEVLMRSLTVSGFGGSMILILMIPFMLLFSYTRTHKNRVFDAVLPLIGIAMIAFVYMEGLYQAITTVGKSIPEEISGVLQMLISQLPQTTP